ncbi:hypothetical protein LTR37_008154 [Vermiconidia calcicola]|uniref:Uncharacterized protein n=1 Tax=Vermiconidia calcicola TaxID=1690605 RepID=A0ACC3NCL2_9PEZI|nr:hypothetical protein LTR37_008154 [Vermiconidia calcicola]
MPPSRHPQDPFTDAPLRPTTSNATSLAPNGPLRNQSSQQSLRSNASAASTRTRQQREGLFATSQARRPANRATPHVEDEVLADSDSEQDLVTQRQKQQQLRRIRHGSPEGKLNRSKPKQDKELDFVNRQPDGSYLLGGGGFGETVAVPQLPVTKTEEEQVDAHYEAISRQYFASGASLGGRSSKKHEEELELLRLPMMMRLREQVMQQLDDERWQYEPLDRFRPAGF